MTKIRMQCYFRHGCRNWTLNQQMTEKMWRHPLCSPALWRGTPWCNRSQQRWDNLLRGARLQKKEILEKNIKKRWVGWEVLGGVFTICTNSAVTFHAGACIFLPAVVAPRPGAVGGPPSNTSASRHRGRHKESSVRSTVAQWGPLSSTAQGSRSGT